MTPAEQDPAEQLAQERQTALDAAHAAVDARNDADDAARAAAAAAHQAKFTRELELMRTLCRVTETPQQYKPMLATLSPGQLNLLHELLLKAPITTRQIWDDTWQVVLTASAAPRKHKGRLGGTSDNFPRGDVKSAVKH